MGGFFGAYLARAGENVVLIDVSKSAVDEINKNGLTSRRRTAQQARSRCMASLNPKSVGPVDLILNFVKCYHTDAAIRAAMPMATPETSFLSLQNGWGNAGRIAAIAGEDRVMVGLTYHSGTLLGPGRVKHPGVGPTHVGELNGKASPRLEAAAAVLRKAGFEVSDVLPDPRRSMEKVGPQCMHASDFGVVAVCGQRSEPARRHEVFDERPPRRRLFQSPRLTVSAWTRASAGRPSRGFSTGLLAPKRRCSRTLKRGGAPRLTSSTGRSSKPASAPVYRHRLTTAWCGS